MELNVFEKLKKNPPLILGVSFACLILVGALLLTLPFASANGQSVGFVNALFTSSSASCVTGLVVANTKEAWSFFGKLVILFCIQIGGLGTMTLLCLIYLFLKRRIGLSERMILKEQLNTHTLTGIVRLIKALCLFTLVIEGMGALLLSIRLIPIYGFKLGIGYGIFHSISAFCNAGFDLFGSSLVPFQSDLYVNLIIMALIVVGGLGFQVYIDIYEKRSFKKLSLHSRMVIETSLVLIFFGGLAILLLEGSNPTTLGNKSFLDKLLVSFFQSVTARTAGYNSIAIEDMTPRASMVMVVLMFIGGSSGSTAGGLKTSTFMVIILTVLASIRGQEDVVWHKRKIGQGTIRMAFVMFFICVFLVLMTTFLLLVFEDGKNTFDLFYEAVSAFATVGLTRNITSDLSTASKLVISLTMFLGRVGPTTVALGLARGSKKQRIHYAEGNIYIG